MTKTLFPHSKLKAIRDYLQLTPKLKEAATTASMQDGELV